MRLRVTFELDPLQEYGVTVTKGTVEVAGESGGKRSRRRPQSSRCDERDLGTQCVEKDGVGVCAPTVQEVSGDNDAETLDMSEVAAQSIRIAKCLGGVVVRAVAGVDHGDLEKVRDTTRGPRLWVTQDNQARAQGL
jgi:hypothetical protein